MLRGKTETLAFLEVIHSASKRSASLCVEALRADVAMKASIHRAAEQRHPEFLCKIVAHGGYTVARYEDRYPALRRLDHHLAGESSGGKQDFIATVDAVQGHPAAHRIERVV